MLYYLHFLPVTISYIIHANKAPVKPELASFLFYFVELTHRLFCPSLLLCFLTPPLHPSQSSQHRNRDPMNGAQRKPRTAPRTGSGKFSGRVYLVRVNLAEGNSR